MAELISTELLVMRTVPYGENALIVGGISPDHGRLSFMEYSGRGSGKKGLSPMGLFRRVNVMYSPSERDIQRYEDVELLEDFYHVSQDYSRYQCACWFSQFAMANILPGISLPYCYQALEVALRRLAEGQILPVSIQTGFLLVYTQENGLMPPLVQEDPHQAAQCQILIEMALGKAVPALTPENWQQMYEWISGILRQSECIFPGE